MINLPEEKKKSGIYYLSSNTNFTSLKETYFNVRFKEGRIYPDEIVKNLPNIPKNHPQHKEWMIRKNSTKSLIKYFLSFAGLEILDLGCGNCWLANYLSTITGNLVYALDINNFELEQGARIFGSNKMLKIIYGNIFEEIFPRQAFDAIIISSAIQYFENFPLLFNNLFRVLKKQGEIHIIDSNFYSDKEIPSAKDRTVSYYQSLGYSEMAQFYHHHNWNELNEFNYLVMNKKKIIIRSLLNRFLISKIKIFPWIKITS